MQMENEGTQKKKHRVRVAIRVRPMVPREIVNNDKSSLGYEGQHLIILNDQKYHFDMVFKDNSRQHEIYQLCVRDLVMKCFDGYNAAILAYGQTGSGKTYTMGTATNTLDDPNSKGIIPRVINDIFQQIAIRHNQIDFNVKVSFLQIYNEQIIDLLSDSIKAKNKDGNINIREEKDGSVSIIGAIEETVVDNQQMAYLLEKGGMHRTTASTLMNEASSRSHSIFTITIQQHAKQKQLQQEGYITAKFVFVDLAGSERIKKTGATGVTLKEGININLGLLELGNVISALATINKKQQQFITYRNSKLTRILQDSLGGNSNTYMIACISPSDFNMEESLNTIKYASKAMNIKNKPVINRDPHSTMILQLRQKINQLEEQNRKLKQIMSESGVRNIQEKVIQSRDLTSDQLKRMKHMYINVEKKNQALILELKEQKKKRNQIEITNYQLKRDRDMLKINIEQIKKINPNILVNTQFQQENKMTVLEEYLSKIQQLNNQILDKDNMNNQLQLEYQKIRKFSQRDQKILIQKNNLIYNLKKSNQKLTAEVKQAKLKLQKEKSDVEQIIDGDKITQQSSVRFQEVLEVEDCEQIQLDRDFTEKQYSFSKMHQQTQTQLKNVDKYIQQKQQFLKQMTSNQIQLQYQLIAEMKEQYHTKISMIEKQKQQILSKQKDDNGVDKNKFKSKIDTLQNQLKQYRRKIKQQSNMEKIVSSQNQKLKDLANQIKKFKMQKIQLGQKLKQDKDNFQKFKLEKMKIIIKSKRDNIKKDAQIKKLTFQNKKNLQMFHKKQQELKKTKKIAQTIKSIMKPKNKKKNETNHTQTQIVDKQYDQIVENSLRNMLVDIDSSIDLERYEQKMVEIQKQLHKLLDEQSLEKIKLQRLQLNKQQQVQQISIQQQQQLDISLRDLKQRISNCEQNFEFCKKKHQEILKTSRQYQIETQVIYNKSYGNVQVLRGILTSLYKSMKSILAQNYQLREIIQRLQIQINTLKVTIEQYKNQVLMLNSQYQNSLTKMRQQMLMKCYSPDEQIDIQNPITNIKVGTPNSKLDEKQKKIYERKILDLTKINRQTTAEVEIWRRKCTIIEQKYRSMRNLLNKDKFIGRQDQLNNSQRDKKLVNTNQSNRGTVMLDEVNHLIQNFNNLQYSQSQNRLKRIYSNQQGPQLIQKLQTEQIKPQFQKNKWECLYKIDAHGSPILSLANYSNFLISSATKSLKIWDIQTQKNVTQLVGVHLPGLVRNVIVNSEKKIIITACQKNIAIWDLLTLKMQGMLKGHKQEVKTLHVANDYLFSGGKGLPNAGSLLVWDFRSLNPNSPFEEKQRNQDIFTITSHQNNLYYGTRNHQVRKMNIENMQILSPFQPPHMDAVTGLAVMGNYLISGSKDKNLRLWGLDNPINNIKFTIHAFNDYINTVTTDTNLPIFYSGARDGQVKIGTIKNQRIDFIGGITTHTQSVNAICSIQQNEMGQLATASSDKTIRVWQPNNQTINNIKGDFC